MIWVTGGSCQLIPLGIGNLPFSKRALILAQGLNLIQGGNVMEDAFAYKSTATGTLRG
jgi:hypothetical protein